MQAAVPPRFPIEHSTGSYDCSADTTLNYDLQPVDLLLSADDVAFDLSPGRIDVTVFATLDSTPTTLSVTGSCSVLTDLDETCDVQIPTTAVEMHLGMTLVAVGDHVDATVDPVDLQISPITNPVSNCTLSSAVGTLLGQNPTAIDDLITGAVQPSLDGLPGQLETSIEDALNSFAIDQTVDLLGTPLDVSLAPTRLQVDSDGITIGMGATLSGETESCGDPSTVPVPTPTWPVLGPTAEGTSLDYDAGVMIGRDFVDEALTSAWGAGLLCMNLQTVGPITLQGSLLGSFFGDEVGNLVEPDAPASIALSASEPPVAEFSGDQPAIRAHMHHLQLDLISELDGRQTRLLGVGVDATIGVDVGLNGDTIAPRLVIDPSTFTFTEDYSDLVGPGYSANLGSLVGTVLSIAVPSTALATIQLPAPLGIGVGQLFWMPTEDQQWLGGYAVLDLSDVQPIEVAGCNASSGCDGGGPSIDLGQALGCNDVSSGCGGSTGGCSSAPLRVPAWPWIPLGFLAALVVCRRRSV